MDVCASATRNPPVRSSWAQRRRGFPPILAALVLGLSGCGLSEPPLPRATPYAIDPARISVSGLSSGAYQAQQLHFAFADRLVGAALLAGGPYGCARGELGTALEQCMAPAGPGPDTVSLAEQIRQRAGQGRLAALDGLAGDRVYVWHGKADAVVAESVSRASAALYAELGVEIGLSTDFERPIGHLLPTAAAGTACATGAPGHIAACGFDLAGEAIRWLHPETPSTATEQASGRLLEIDVRPVDGSDSPGLDSAFVYVPAACSVGQTCGLHIALHGCEQSAEVLGRRFAEEAGFNRWADAAQLIVLYPQARSSLMPLNPKGCWDWWGYSGPDYDTREGAQPRWIAAMADELGAPLAAPAAASAP